LSSTYKTVLSFDKTQEDKGLAWYTCGPTTYAPAHLGHARTYVCIDILRRVLEHTQSNSKRPAPLFVINITDVDDKILAAAKETLETPLALARRYEKEFWEDVDSLNCLRPHVVTRVTEHVTTDIVPYIEKLVQEEMAYITEEGVYFDVREFDSRMGHCTKYGKLAPPSAATDFFNSHETSPDDCKRDSRDFSLWKIRKEGEDVYWPSPWGEGRPGWHIECSAMIESVQTQFHKSHVFQIHAGGVDLKFPHHTNEIAQAEVYRRHRIAVDGEWIPHWIHTGHLHIAGMKMSKSLKNFITIRQLFDEEAVDSALSSPADDFRLWCLGLSGSYRGPATYSNDRLAEARVTREKLVKFLLEGEDWLGKSCDSAVKRWGDEEFALFDSTMTASANCHAALMGCQELKYFDMDGSSYIQSLVELAELGRLYMTRVNPGEGPTEALYTALNLLRTQLSLVGFSNATVKAGRAEEENVRSHICGGERALAQELVQLRSAIRKCALEDIRNNTSTARTREILRLCDQARDVILPSIGLELSDDKIADEDKNTSRWWFCLPRQTQVSPPKENRKNEKRSATVISRFTALEDLFRVGAYEGMFSLFDEEGIPTHNSNGSEVSKRERKKLMKKKDKYEKWQEKKV
jgi:cysteinyl-tRNA synthetase